MASKDVSFLIFPKLPTIADCISFAMTSRDMMRHWQEWLRLKVAPHLEFQTSFTHMAIIWAEFRGEIGNPGFTLPHERWWYFSKSAMKRLFTAGDCRHFTVQIPTEKLQRIRCRGGDDGVQSLSHDQAIQSYCTRRAELRAQDKMKRNKMAINGTALSSELLQWVNRLPSVRQTYPVWALLGIQVSSHHNHHHHHHHHLVNEHVQELRKWALPGFFKAIIDHDYGVGYSSCVPILNRVVMRHKETLWEEFIDASKPIVTYSVESFRRDVFCVIRSFSKTIRKHIIVTCSDERVEQLDVAQTLLAQCRGGASEQDLLQITRLIREESRLNTITVGDIMTHHMYAKSVHDEHQLLCLIEQCFPQRIFNPNILKDTIPSDRNCIYQVLDHDFVFNQYDRVFTHLTFIDLREARWFIQAHLHCDIKKLAQDIDWHVTIRQFFGQQCNIVYARHGILKRIYQLQQQNRAIEERVPNLWKSSARESPDDFQSPPTKRICT